MKFQKTLNLLGNTTNQPCKFKTKNWVEINDNSRGTYNTNSQNKLKTLMLKPCLGDYSDAYIFFKGTVSFANMVAAYGNANNNDKEVIFKNCAPFIDCISELNTKQIDNSKDIGVLMPIVNLI